MIRNSTASKVIQYMEKMFCTHRLSIRVQSDSGPQFTSELFTKYMSVTGVKLSFSSQVFYSDITMCLIKETCHRPNH